MSKLIYGVKQLFKSDKNSVLGGVLGGMGEYFEIDATVMRLIFLFLTLISGVVPGVIFYIIALFIIPSRSDSASPKP